jgi:predicted DCC family thiol-disulfide oxidoreductase YuxK
MQYTLLYDGNCRMCTGQAQMVARYDDDQRLELLDINSDTARQRFPQISPRAARAALHLAAPDGSLYRGPEAVRQTLMLLPMLSPLGALLYLPGMMVLAHPVYNWVARNRYLFGGTTETCDDGTCTLDT